MNLPFPICLPQDHLLPVLGILGIILLFIVTVRQFSNRTELGFVESDIILPIRITIHFNKKSHLLPSKRNSILTKNLPTHPSAIQFLQKFGIIEAMIVNRQTANKYWKNIMFDNRHFILILAGTENQAHPDIKSGASKIMLLIPTYSPWA